MIKQGDFLSLEALRKRYNADEVLILTVQQESPPLYNVTTQTYPLDESLGVHLDFAVSSASTDLLDINKKIIQKVLKKNQRQLAWTTKLFFSIKEHECSYSYRKFIKLDTSQNSVRKNAFFK